MKKIFSVLSVTLALSAGFAAGFFVSKRHYKKKYEKQADDEVAAIEEIYRKKSSKEKENMSKETPSSKNHVSKSSLDDMAKKPLSKEPEDYSERYRSKEPEVLKERPNTKKKKKEPAITILSPDEFKASAYNVTTWYYWADDVLTDSYDKVIPDSEYAKHIGKDALKSFGQYESDVVYVANSEEGIAYEIELKDERYSASHSEYPRD